MNMYFRGSLILIGDPWPSMLQLTTQKHIKAYNYMQEQNTNKPFSF